METDKKVAVSAEAPEPSQMSLDTPVTDTNGTKNKVTKRSRRPLNVARKPNSRIRSKAAEPPSAGTEQPPSEVTERSRSARTEQGRSPRPERTRPEQRRARSPAEMPVLSPAEVNNPATKTPNNSQKSSDRSPPNPTKNS